MPASRSDLGPEGNAARRRFWEMCAATALAASPPEESAREADEMLMEWDRRWIAEEEDREVAAVITEYFDVSEALRRIEEERQRHDVTCPRRTGFATCTCKDGGDA